MKLTLFFLLPVALAFAPVHPSSKRATSKLLSNEVDDACATITSKTEVVLEKTDSVLLSRAVRVADHAPMIITLKYLADKAGMACTQSSITAAPSAFAGLGTALSIPTWCYNIWALIAVTQIASVAKSALAEDSNELSQSAITTTSVANILAMRAVSSANPLLDTALTAIVGGYGLRKNGGDGSVTVHKAALQLMVSFTTVLTTLGAISAVAAKVSFLNEQVTSVLGIAAFYIMATRSGNGTVKKAVNAGIIGGVLYSRIAAGVSLSLDVASVVSGVTTIGAAYVAYEAINRLRKAVMD